MTDPQSPQVPIDGIMASVRATAGISVLIPAYNPDDRLLHLIDSLTGSGFSDIIVVDDGSSAESRRIFERIKEIEQCHMVTHAANFGKGRALKTGMNYFLLNFPDGVGVVTADADGQHISEDILRVAESLKATPDRMILGARSFDESSPLRSLIGNVITRLLFSFLVGMKVSDTQTGLRGIPKEHLAFFLQLEGERYEYEMNMLIALKNSGIGLKEEKISTIYIENNRSSHFNPLVDSMRIYFFLVRFAFHPFSRVVASVVNFTVNRRLVFHYKERVVHLSGQR